MMTSQSVETLDFIFRPLFRPSRKPPAQLKSAPPVAVQQMPEVASMKILSGYILLGVFASGETSGAIVATKEGQRQRLYVGDQLDGWRLQGTSLRTAYFENAAGAEAAIELAIASSLPRLPTVAAAPSNESASAIAVGGESTGSGQMRWWKPQNAHSALVAPLPLNRSEHANVPNKKQPEKEREQK